MGIIGHIIGIFFILWIVIREFTIPGSEKKTCRHCGERIPYNARSCPYCRRDPGIGSIFDYVRVEVKALGKPFIVFLIVAFIYTAVGALTGINF